MNLLQSRRNGVGLMLLWICHGNVSRSSVSSVTGLTGGGFQGRYIVIPEGALCPPQLPAVAQGSAQLLVVVPRWLSQDTWPRRQQLSEGYTRQRQWCIGITKETQRKPEKHRWKKESD